MALPGNWTWFNKALQRVSASDLTSHTVKAILVTTTQTFDENFVGASGNAQYSDITNELTTANGYTVAGVTLSGLAIALSSGTIKWTASTFSWTVTGAGLTFRWVVLVDTTSGNLIAFADLNTDGATNIVANAGPLGFSPTSSAFLTWDQP